MLLLCLAVFCTIAVILNFTSFRLSGKSSHDNIIQLSNMMDDFVGKTEVMELSVNRGDSLAAILSRIGIAPADIHAASQAISQYMRLRDLRPNQDTINVHYVPLEDDKKEIRTIEIVRSPIHRIIATREPDGAFTSTQEHQTASLKLVRKQGMIDKNQTLIAVAMDAKIPYNIIDRFYDVFSFDVDFERDIHPGTTFSVLYQEKYTADGQYIGPGDLIHATFTPNARRGTLKLYRFIDERGNPGFFNEKAESATKTLKRTPINAARLSSRFGMRRHPVLGFSRHHAGVDFAAPAGTPIPAAGSGTITFRGWKPGYGNYISIRHNSTYSTAYAHLKSFRPGQRVGTHVNQGTIIGYVGNTGISTGPHLHYEIIKGGVQVNPLTVVLPSTQQLSKTDTERFHKARDTIDLQYRILEGNYFFGGI